MTKGRIQPRDITTEEIEVIRAVLDRAAGPQHPELTSGVERLRVVSVCGCGCASVTFVDHDAERRSRPVAHVVGKTTTGGTVGVIVWGLADQVTGLEIYDLGAGPYDQTLPIPTSLEPFSTNTRDD